MSVVSNNSQKEAPADQAVSGQEGDFDRKRRLLGAVATPLVFLATWLATSGSLSAEGRKVAAVLAAVGVLWITEVVPLPVAALLGPVLCVLLGVADAKTALAPFADPIVFLFIGSFILARAMVHHRLDRRIAMAFLSLPWIGGRPARVLAGMGIITALISMWVSNSATTAMMLPVALGILETLHLARERSGAGASLDEKGTGTSLRSEPVPALPVPGVSHDLRDWPYASGMMLLIAYAASIGGIGTPVGSPPNLIAIGFLRSLAGVEISFLRWMSLAVPTMLAMGLVLFLVLYLFGANEPPGREARGELRHYLSHQRAILGPWTRGQVNVLAAFALAVALWVMPGVLSLVLGEGHWVVQSFQAHVPEAVAALAAAGLLFILPINLREGRFTLTWEEAVKIDWGTILLFGGGLSLGTLMFKTGVAEALGRGITSLTGSGSLWTLTAAAIAMGILISETTSNTASANMVVPVVIALALAARVDPVPPALGATFGASCGFMLPVSTPPNAIVYGSGLVPITRMIRAGVLVDLLGFFVIFASLRILYALLEF